MKFIMTPLVLLFLVGAPHVFALRNLCGGDNDGGESSSTSSSTSSASESESAYIASVCSPATAPDQSDAAPCIAIQSIESACEPNGTSPLALDAHAQCLCNGSYFSEWIGCRRCLLAHGALSPRNFSYFTTVLASASNELCNPALGTPTAAFATLFAEAQAAIPEPTTGNTMRTDSNNWDAAVSVYYTESGPQGPGVITGSATEATASLTESVSGSGSAVTVGESLLSAGARSSTGIQSATTSSLSNVAVPTVLSSSGRGAIIAAVVGGALAVAL